MPYADSLAISESDAHKLAYAHAQPVDTPSSTGRIAKDGAIAATCGSRRVGELRHGGRSTAGGSVSAPLLCSK